MEVINNRRRLSRQLRVAVLLSCSAAVTGHLFAWDATPDFQNDPFELLAARIVGTVLVVSIVLVGYALNRARRGRLAGPAGRRLMLIGVVLLPSFSVTTGSLLVFTRAERVEFCASCHRAMQPYVEEMTDPDNSGLAAIHFKNRYIPSNQCFECHTSYGLFGNFEVKLRGIGDVFQYYTGTYEMPIRQAMPYSNGDCLKCHALSNTWISVEAHTHEDNRL
jgi:nitrate/TMAO reductase-like tetraheme cytochrome c subunit